MIDQLLEEIGEDKHQNMTTTSLKLKRDVWEFFQGFEDKIAVEFGTHKGQTTKILSHLFKKVYTVNNQDNAEAKRLNEDIQNIEYISNFDLYSKKHLPIKDIVDVFFIDAGHSYEQVLLDAQRAINMKCAKKCYIIFDDYGLQNHSDNVKRAVDKIISTNTLMLVKGIGHTEGHSFNNSDPNYNLIGPEGLITTANWEEIIKLSNKLKSLKNE